jgi:DNA-binding MarR family transcriptional regulator
MPAGSNRRTTGTSEGESPDAGGEGDRRLGDNGRAPSSGEDLERPVEEENCSPGSVAFLLAQVGARAAMAFARRLSALGLEPPDAGILRMLSVVEGLSQREMADRLSILPSRLVHLVDELEEKGLVERRSDPDDRRTHALHLTERGSQMMNSVGQVACEHNEALCAGLSLEERTELSRMLGRVAAQQGLAPGVHPGYSQMGRRRRRR